MFKLSYMAQMVKNVPAMQETCVRSLGGQDSLEKGMATHSSIFAWRISWTEEPVQVTVRGVAKSQTHPSDRGRCWVFLTAQGLSSR